MSAGVMALERSEGCTRRTAGAWPAVITAVTAALWAAGRPERAGSRRYCPLQFLSVPRPLLEPLTDRLRRGLAGEFGEDGSGDAGAAPAADTPLVSLDTGGLRTLALQCVATSSCDLLPNMKCYRVCTFSAAGTA